MFTFFPDYALIDALSPESEIREAPLKTPPLRPNGLPMPQNKHDEGLAPEDLPLSPRMEAFVREYLVDMNATQAAIRAGYSAATAGSKGGELLALPRVAIQINTGKAQRLAALGISAEAIVAELDALARSNVQHYIITDDGQVSLAEGAPLNAMSAIQSIKKKTTVDKQGNVTYDVELKLWDKPGALKLMGKHANVKACFDKVEVSGPDGGPIPITEVRSVIVDTKGDK